MSKKLKGKELERIEAERDVWQEVLESVREIKAGGGKRTRAVPKSSVSRVRLKSGLSQSEFATVLGVSKRTLEQWEQGRREPSGAAKTLLRITERHPEVVVEVARESARRLAALGASEKSLESIPRRRSRAR